MATMTASKSHDEIVVDSEKAGTPGRRGEILEILEESYGIRYRVRWEDGRESVIHPVAGTVHIVHHDHPHDDHIDEAQAKESCCGAFSEIFR